MRTMAIVIAATMALGSGAALAATGAVTNTSVSNPVGSPSDAAPRSAVIPGTPAHRHALALGESSGKVVATGSWHPKGGSPGKSSQPQ